MLLVTFNVWIYKWYIVVCAYSQFVFVLNERYREKGGSPIAQGRPYLYL